MVETKPVILQMDANCSTMKANKARNGVGVSVRIHQDNVLEVCRSEGDDGEASVVCRAMYVCRSR